MDEHFKHFDCFLKKKLNFYFIYKIYVVHLGAFF
jgi:hypothetical protein